MPQLFHHDAPKQPERHEAPLGFDLRRVPKWLAGPQQQLAFDDLDVRALVAHDDHAVDQHLRALDDREADIRGGIVLDKRDDGLDDYAVVSPIAIREIDAIPIACGVDL